MEKIIVGEVAWLRNDYRADIVIAGITYPTLEHAYQASKTKDRSVKQSIADTDSVREARKIGRKCQQDANFDREKSMEALLRRKFTDEELGKQLAETGNTPIVMEGYSDFWGTGDNGDGQNVMGEMLQTIRSELQLVYGVDPDEVKDGCCAGCCAEDEKAPLLKDAILDAPDAELAQACQDLFDAAKDITSFLDANDYNAEYLAQKTGRPKAELEAAIKSVQNFQETISKIEGLLETPSDEEESDDESDEDDEDDLTNID